MLQKCTRKTVEQPSIELAEKVHIKQQLNKGVLYYSYNYLRMAP
jgi:hypothetical protein